MTAALRPPADANPAPVQTDGRGLFLWLWRGYLSKHWRWLIADL